MEISNVQMTIIILTVILFSAIVAIMIFSAYELNKLNILKKDFSGDLDQYCSSLQNIIYRRSVRPPHTNGVYEENLSTALLDVALNVTRSNCENILPIPNPPGYTNQLRIEGIDPVDGQLRMFAYIFWNVETCSVIFAFTGTASVSEWVSDFEYTLVDANKLHGYVPNVKCNKGFYNIYTSVQSQLWDWWYKNSSWVTYFYITGHSLGGALSTIAAYDFGQVFSQRCTYMQYPIHYSFAAPRSGNVEYANLFNERLPTSIRVNNSEDLVPQLPPAEWRGNTFEQTQGSIIFTKSLGSLLKNHVNAYILFMPSCSDVAPCN